MPTDTTTHSTPDFRVGDRRARPWVNHLERGEERVPPETTPIEASPDLAERASRHLEREGLRR